ncbi:MAG: NUDIX hydrolase [Patescibacteria group bacterium]
MTHVVVGIIKKDNPPSYLLVSSKRDFDEYTGYYYPPAGHVEDGEDELTALKREIDEELKLNVTGAEKITDTMGDVRDQKTSWYVCEVDGYDFSMDGEELKDAGFFTQKEMASMKIWPATLEIFNRFIFKENFSEKDIAENDRIMREYHVKQK